MKSTTLVSLVLPALAYAQRPPGISICDYYTTALLTDNTAANQYTLLTLLVNTVVIGNYSQVNTGVVVPGILAPGVVNGEAINLLPYFNGCLESTNVDDKPASVNFLDGGGADPLTRNLPADDTTSNQYGLLTHLYQFIGKLIGCSTYGQTNFPSYQGDPSMYRVHKYMGLDSNQLAYFGQQVVLSALSFGVTQDDVNLIAQALSTTFGYRCSPPADIIGGPQLESICDASSCPLDPAAQCGLYPDGGSEPSPSVAPQCPSTTTSAVVAATTSAYVEQGYGGWSDVYEGDDWSDVYENDGEEDGGDYEETYTENSYGEGYYEEDDGSSQEWSNY